MSAPDTSDAADLAYRADPSNWATDREAFHKGWKAGMEAAAKVCDRLAQEAERMGDLKRAEYPSHPEGAAWDCASLRLDDAAKAIRATGGKP